MASTETQENDQRRDNTDAEIDALLNRSLPRCRRKALYQAPEFVQRLNSFEEVKAGTTATFQCKFKAFPKASIKWFKDDEDITEDCRYEVTELDADHLELRIAECCKRDEGAYKCKAENAEGVASSTGYLSVTGSIKDKPLSAQPRKTQSEHMISTAPHLRTITEQRSVEEQEAEVTESQPPSPLHHYIAQMQKVRSWPTPRPDYLDTPQPPCEQNGETHSQNNGKVVFQTDDIHDTEDDMVFCDEQDNGDETTDTDYKRTNIREVEMIERHSERKLFSSDDNQNMTAKICMTTAESDDVSEGHSKSEVDCDKWPSSTASTQPDLNNDTSAEDVSDVRMLAECKQNERTKGSQSVYPRHDSLMFFLVLFVSVTTAWAAATEMSPSLFVIFIAVVSLLSFAFFQLTHN